MAKNEVKESKPKKRYFKDMKAELKKVIWPTPKQTANNTMAVIVFTLIIAIVVFVLDLVFDSIHKYGVTPLQEKIQSSYSASNNTTTDNSTTEENSTENENSTAENSTEENTSAEDTNSSSEENSESSESNEVENNTNSEE